MWDTNNYSDLGSAPYFPLSQEQKEDIVRRSIDKVRGSSSMLDIWNPDTEPVDEEDWNSDKTDTEQD